MPLPNKKYDVIVVGAGIVGATFALKLAKESDFTICVVEHSAQLTRNKSPNQRVFALGEVAIGLLESVEAFNFLTAESRHPYTRMFVWDDHSNGELEFKAADYQRESLGQMVDATSLTIALQAKLSEHSQIDVKYSQQLDTLSLTESVASIELAAQSKTQKAVRVSAPLIVAADGVNSWSRQQAKIFANYQNYNQQGIVALIKTELNHQNTAWQVFLSTGPLALLPLSDNQCSIVWSADDQFAEELNELNNQEFANQIKNAMGAKLGNVDLLSQRQSFALKSLQAQTYFKHRFALLGDAAHSIHPLAGQGANIGLKDVISLTKILSATSANKLGDLVVLSRYQSERKPDNEQTNAMMNFLHTAYQADKGTWPMLRGLGMNTTSHSKLLKMVLAKQAMGL